MVTELGGEREGCPCEEWPWVEFCDKGEQSIPESLVGEVISTPPVS